MLQPQQWMNRLTSSVVIDLQKFSKVLKELGCKGQGGPCHGFSTGGGGTYIDRFPTPAIDFLPTEIYFTIKDIEFIAKTDPTVVEIVPRHPVELATWLECEPLIQTFIYDTAKKAGLNPATQFANGMHWNLDYESFFGEKKGLFRNFLVDFFNHSELVTGALLEDEFNASHTLHDDDNLRRFSALIQKYDQGGMTDKWFLMESSRILTRNSVHYQAVTIRGTEATRIEFRFFRQTDTAEQMNRLLNLFVKRIDYLERSSKKTELASDFPIYGRTYGENLYRKGKRYFNSSNSDIDQGILRFAEYIQESGLDFEDYQFTLKKSWQARIPKLKNELASIKAGIPIKSCNEIIEGS